MGKLRLGIIGCGIAARELHWPAIKAHEADFEVSALANRSLSKAEALAAMIESEGWRRPACHADYRELLARHDVDVAVIALPIELNREACEAAIAAGKAVMLEKPLAHTVEDAWALVELGRAHPEFLLMVAENFRYREAYARLKAELDSGRLGEPYHAEWRAWQKVEPASNQYAKTPWRLAHRYEGGFVTDGGVHNIAALRDLFGDLEVLAARKASINPAIGRTDFLAMSFIAGGVSGLLSLAFSASGPYENELSVLCAEGRAVVRGDRLSLYSRDGGEKPYFDGILGGDGGYKAEYADLARCLREGRQPQSGFEDAYKDLETMLGALSRALEPS
jgi:predicted dehydrogenase